MNEEQERTCKICAWWTAPKNSFVGWCHYECQRIETFRDYWCRHWSERRGWQNEQ